jgi:hypothetical protein
MQLVFLVVGQLHKSNVLQLTANENAALSLFTVYITDLLAGVGPTGGGRECLWLMRTIKLSGRHITRLHRKSEIDARLDFSSGWFGVATDAVESLSAAAAAAASGARLHLRVVILRRKK